VTERDEDDESPMARWLLREHGPFLPAPVTAKILGFKSTEALRQARCRHQLPVPMFAIEGRRGWFASTTAVAAWVEQTLERSTKNSSNPHG
jgi:hypothetical protein